ncbi:MAG: hypothetical protein ABUS79_22220, partial [Pseudomonadota bacterium]
MPDDVTNAQVGALNRARAAKPGRQRPGRILHVGPYADEPASLAAIDAVLRGAGLAPAPSHVEVYRKDPRRVLPAALETVLLREVAAP